MDYEQLPSLSIITHEQRTTSSPDSDRDAMQILRHTSLYYAHGDIALSAQYSDTVKYIFRVHRLFLTHHSEVFQDKIEALARDDGLPVEEYDGVPLLVLDNEDSSDGVASLLEVFYDVSSLPRRLAAEQRADLPLQLCGLLDISTRYHVQGVVSTIKDHIRKEWPVTLRGWEVRQLEFDSTPILHDVLPEAVSAIQFATEYNIPSILPAAFYLLSITPTNSDWRDQIPKSNVSSARWFSLDDSNAVRFAKGRDAMIAFYLDEAAKLDPGQDQYGFNMLSTHPRCKCDYSPLLLELRLLAVNRHLDCLRALSILSDRCKHDHKLCTSCMTRMRTHFQHMRTEIWKKLPDFFIVREDGNRITWNA
ncbi:hypothetical protein PHLGIDRAFT_161150 [Phlebiopsis gigantea 11061_1 CR5-6]|uniref:BTB domain-containing protein n=1 Tax=Phlebiopsis gigantea (strain 11061_1 CR5-6) TaxID=745531 RepID=A0A0C3NK37_PHLG1|nr:hypothetical protein PHLGIDRAFT_161150 [Phlebiopsis gigantea 11061_1 CR5-6]